MGQTIPENEKIDPRSYLPGRNAVTGAVNEISDSFGKKLMAIALGVFLKCRDKDWDPFLSSKKISNTSMSHIRISRDTHHWISTDSIQLPQEDALHCFGIFVDCIERFETS